MKIAVIGSGNMGRALGLRWTALGHEVMFGTRDPEQEKIKSLLKETEGKAQARSIRAASQFGDIILLAVLPEHVESVLAEAGEISGKILINCTNRYDGLSADAEVRRLAPSAVIVRAFHTLPWEVLADSYYEGGVPAVFMYGDDPEAVKAVAALASEIGLDPVDTGNLDVMNAAESAIGALWGVLAPQYGRDYSLSVLRR